jgi:hypothetical protein
LEYSFAKTVGSTTSFSVEKLRNELHRAGFHRPSLAGDTVDWNLVEIRRQEFNMLFTGQLSVALLPQPQDRALIEALGKFRTDEFAEALALWPAEHAQPDDPILQLALGQCYAELGRPECLELAAAAAVVHPIDAAAVRATYHWRIANIGAAAREVEQFYTLLQTNPWVISIFSEPALEFSVDIAKVDHAAAERFYALLSEPFASRRFHFLRMITRVMVAERLGPEKVVEAVADFEPEIVWAAEVLEPRAKAYAAVNHPFAARAQREWEWYQKHAPAEAEKD